MKTKENKKREKQISCSCYKGDGYDFDLGKKVLSLCEKCYTELMIDMLRQIITEHSIQPSVNMMLLNENEKLKAQVEELSIRFHKLQQICKSKKRGK